MGIRGQRRHHGSAGDFHLRAAPAVKPIIPEELGTDELVQLMYEIAKEIEARLIYGREPGRGEEE